MHRGGGGFSRGRKLSAEDLQLVLLSLLEDRPAHGYELIGAIEERSGGYYSPSPGVIYPALAALNEAGWADVATEGKRKSYAITDAGRGNLESERDRVDEILESLGRIGSRMDRVRAAFEGDDEPDQEAEERFKAMRGIKRALRSKRGCSAEEAKRITAILKRAADEIAEPQG